jgi:hypothetical protein
VSGTLGNHHYLKIGTKYKELISKLHMAATFIVVLSGTKTKEIWNSVWHSEPGKIQSPGKNEEI